jgi:hypothetical protein
MRCTGCIAVGVLAAACLLVTAGNSVLQLVGSTQWFVKGVWPLGCEPGLVYLESRQLRNVAGVQPSARVAVEANLNWFALWLVCAVIARFGLDLDLYRSGPAGFAPGGLLAKGFPASSCLTWPVCITCLQDQVRLSAKLGSWGCPPP